MTSISRALALGASALMAVSFMSACSGGYGQSGASSPVGTWGQSSAQSPNLTFAADGTVTGTDGCNRLSGAWTQYGDEVRFPNMITTLMACPDVDTWLSTGVSAVVTGDTLEVHDKSGGTIGSLERQKDS